MAKTPPTPDNGTGEVLSEQPICISSFGVQIAPLHEHVMRKLRCKSALTELFDLKVDLIVGLGDKPIHRIAKTTGIRLK